MKNMLRNPMMWIILLAMLLRLFRAQEIGVHLDEATSFFIASAPVPNIYRLLMRYMHNAPPLFYILAHFSLLISDSPVAFRLPSIIAGVAGVGLTYRLGKVVFSERAGLIAAFLLSVSPMHIYSSQEARMYSLFCLFSIMSLLFFFRIMRDDKKSDWSFWTIVNLLNLYTHFFAGLLIFAQGLCIAAVAIKMGVRNKRFKEASSILKKLVASAVTTAVLILPLAPALLHPKGISHPDGSGPLFQGPPLDFVFFQELFKEFSTRNDASWAYFLLFAGGVCVATARKNGKAGMLVACFLIPIVTANAYLRHRSFFEAKYVIMGLPIYLLFIGYGITSLADKARDRYPEIHRRSGHAIVVGLAVLLSMFAFFKLAKYYELRGGSGRTLRDNWKHCAEYIKANISAGDAIGFYQGYTQYIYDFHDQDEKVMRLWFSPEKDMANLAERDLLLERKYNYVLMSLYDGSPDYVAIQNAVRTFERLWMVFSYAYPPEGQVVLEHFLEENYETVETKNFGRGVQLVVYRIRSAETAGAELQRQILLVGRVPEENIPVLYSGNQIPISTKQENG